MNPDSFDPKKLLVFDKTSTVHNPEAVSHLEFKQWVEGLEQVETPLWSGLPPQANDLLNIQRIQSIFLQFAKV